LFESQRCAARIGPSASPTPAKENQCPKIRSSLTLWESRRFNQAGTALGHPKLTVTLREVLLWTVSLLLMVALNYFVQRTKMGKAMRATAQDLR
jgi:branched-subunit amino acid ABC-type transport system permease component